MEIACARERIEGENGALSANYATRCSDIIVIVFPLHMRGFPALYFTVAFNVVKRKSRDSHRLAQALRWIKVRYARRRINSTYLTSCTRCSINVIILARKFLPSGATAGVASEEVYGKECSNSRQ